MGNNFNSSIHDIGIVRTDGSKVGLMLAQRNGVPQYSIQDVPFLANQITTDPDYGSLPPEQEVAMRQDNWEDGFGLEYHDRSDPDRYYASYGMDLRFKGMGIAGPKATAVTLPPGITTAATIVNGNMELTTGWTYGSRSNLQAYNGTYSWEVPETVDAYQDASTWDNSWRGKTFTFYCWVYATVANIACIGIRDGVGNITESSRHPGDST